MDSPPQKSLFTIIPGASPGKKHYADISGGEPGKKHYTDISGANPGKSYLVMISGSKPRKILSCNDIRGKPRKILSCNDIREQTPENSPHVKISSSRPLISPMVSSIFILSVSSSMRALASSSILSSICLMMPYTRCLPFRSRKFSLENS